ncbi:hypothetical protein MLPF_3357 [Mycobacterium lepromatosis]|nr:hypothetical protein MLPF_3357 [Mycobacterium lepromatosis]
MCEKNCLVPIQFRCSFCCLSFLGRSVCLYRYVAFVAHAQMRLDVVKAIVYDILNATCRLGSW